MESKVFKNRREKLGNQLNDGEIVIIFAAEEPVGINRFLQNNNFLYLTGLYDVPEAVFALHKHNGKVRELLFIQRNIPERIVWDGAKMYPDEATELSEIAEVKFLDEFDDVILYSLSLAKTVYINTGIVPFKKPMNKALLFANKIRERMLHLDFAEADLLLTPLRQIKDESEIEYLTKAIEVTGAGLEHIFRNARAGMYEYELEAMLFYEMRRRGLTHYGFAPIIAAGVNATTLHYIANDTLIAENDLVLCDVGALFKNYSADITRTFPVSGRFTPRQKEVYSEVLNVQKTIISMIAPEVSLADLNKKAGELIGEACVRLGLINDPADFKKYYMHSIGHHLGMNTHDLGARDSVLCEGMVTTIEPGIYIPEENIGVRIEDDILVTADGYKILSSMIPKEIEELEGFINH